jgi:hypothetical protein
MYIYKAIKKLLSYLSAELCLAPRVEGWSGELKVESLV